MSDGDTIDVSLVQARARFDEVARQVSAGVLEMRVALLLSDDGCPMIVINEQFFRVEAWRNRNHFTAMNAWLFRQCERLGEFSWYQSWLDQTEGIAP